MPYKLLGMLVWWIAKRLGARKLAQNRAKLGAVAVIALVLVAGIAAARAERSDD